MFRKLFWDDIFVVLAMVITLASAIVWQTFMAHDMYELMGVSAGLEPPGPTFVIDSDNYSKASTAVQIFFYSTLWSVKISFLIFFRRLGKNVRRQKFLWWPIFSFTVATYIASVGMIQYRCLINSLLYLIENCTSDSAVKYQE